MHANIHLGFTGQCEEAFAFYVKVCNGAVEMMMKYSDAPAGMPVTPESKDKVMHARIKLGDTVLMGADAPPGRGSKQEGFCVSLTADSGAEAERVFSALSEGGNVQMPMASTFFAEKFGMCVDRFGTPWMVVFNTTPG